MSFQGPPNSTPPIHHPCTDTMHGPACPSSQTQIPPHLTYRHQDYMILLLMLIMGSSQIVNWTHKFSFLVWLYAKNGQRNEKRKLKQNNLDHPELININRLYNDLYSSNKPIDVEVPGNETSKTNSCFYHRYIDRVPYFHQ